MNLTSKIIELRERCGKYEGICRFAIVLLCAHFFWKYTVLGDEYGYGAITFLGADITSFFDWFSLNIAETTHRVLTYFGMPTYLVGTTVRHLSNDFGCHIVWACTGIKQAFVFTMILLLSRGRWIHKIWYIALGLILVYIVNLLRIIIIVAFMRDYPEWFHFLHEYLFKYLFYGIIFLIWVFWEDFLVSRLS